MKCPACEADLKYNIIREFEYEVTGWCAVYFASPDEENIDPTPCEMDKLRRVYTGPYVCFNCKNDLEEELVYAHYKEVGEENEMFRRVPPGMGSVLC